MDSGSDASTYETYAILIINVLLLLERIFKNGKFFIKCSSSGLMFTNRTPTVSPAESQDNADSPTESPDDLRRDEDHFGESDPDSDELDEFRRWKARQKARKHMKKHNRERKNNSTEERE